MIPLTMTKKNFLLALMLLTVATTQAGKYSQYYQNLPTPVKQVEDVVISQLKVSLTDFGGVGDGVTLCTEAFQKGIAQ